MLAWLLAGGAVGASKGLAQPASHLADNGKPYAEVPPDPRHHFNYPYILFFPPQAASACQPHLIVEPNNAGGVSADDALLNEARAAAIRVATHGSLGNDMAQRFGFPLLVPIFPRPPLGTDSDVDTYSLSRAALLQQGKLKRLDLQLLAMIANAQSRLRAAGKPVAPTILMTGFSGSALFTSRFVFLHPTAIAAAAFGGLNSFVTIPARSWHGRLLEFPLGLADYAAITGYAFDGRAYDAVPQLAFQGENDDNDAIPMDDEYTTQERDTVWALFGKKMYPDRWLGVQSAYTSLGATVAFKTYAQIGHSFDQRADEDAANLFQKALTCKH